MTGATDDALMRIYERALYDVHLPDGKVTLLHRRAPVGASDPIRGRRLVIVTAYNPGHARPSEAENAAANARLRAEIERRGLDWYPAAGYARVPAADEPDAHVEEGHSEPSFAVMDVDVEVGVELGLLFDQAAIFYWDRRRGSVVPCA